jgi:hypothetical protein
MLARPAVTSGAPRPMRSPAPRAGRPRLRGERRPGRGRHESSSPAILRPPGLGSPGLLTGALDEDDGVAGGDDFAVGVRRPGRAGPAGALVFSVSWWWSFGRDFGDGPAGAGLVDDGLVGGKAATRA